MVGKVQSESPSAQTAPSSWAAERRPPTVLIETLGCKVNQYDSDRLALSFAEHGFTAVVDHRLLEVAPDLVVVNTCSVTEESERKGRQLIRRLARSYPSARIIVTGCSARIHPAPLRALPMIHAVYPTTDQAGLVRQAVSDLGFTASSTPRSFPLGRRTRRFVKVQEGCDSYCTYCSIPWSRGSPRSRPIRAVREEVVRLVEQGFREVVLCGTRLGSYGRDVGSCLAELMLDLAGVDGLARLRLSSLEPEDLDEALVDVWAEIDILCPHLHLPVQSGSDRVLSRMGRGYTRDDYLCRTEYARKRIADLCVSTDIMVGFPGETEEDFGLTLSLVESVGFSKVHSFPYSARPGTAAASMADQVPPPVRRERRMRLDRLASARAEQVRLSFIGRTMPILVEKIEDGHATGLTPNYLRVKFLPSPRLAPGTIVDVRLRRLSGLVLLGEPCTEGDGPGEDPEQVSNQGRLNGRAR